MEKEIRISFPCATLRWVAVCIAACALWMAPTLRAQEHFTVMEWNVENLFDPIDDPEKQDDDFLPQAARRWTWTKFTDKLNRMSKVIAAAGGDLMPDLVAMCEVESDTAMWRLTRTALLRRARYGYFMTHGLDARGINVALLYRPETFRPVGFRSLRPDFSGLPHKLTRDVLHATGILLTGDTLDVFVCHLPSRLDPHKRGRPYRERVAAMVSAACDSLARVRGEMNVIITGDFNEDAKSDVIRRSLGAKAAEKADAALPEGLYCLTDRDLRQGPVRGTYCYRGKWETIDHMIVSGHLLNDSARVHIAKDGCSIFAAPFLLTEKDGEVVPLRTFSGVSYQKGYSDHLPLVARFSYSW